jgi:hypothetical protein
LREPIRVGLPAQRRVECAYGAALDCFVAALLAMTGWIGFRAESAEGAEAISLRSRRSLREPNQIRRFQLERAFDKLRRSGADFYPTPLRLSLSKPGVAKHPSTSSG